MPTSNTLKQKIENILEQSQQARNSDKVLQALLWQKYYNLRYNKDKDIWFVAVMQGDKVMEEFMNLPLEYIQEVAKDI